jgi:hypothetical protein
MKKIITGYITAMINSYTRTITRLESIGANTNNIKTLEAAREDLNDLLDFVEDLPGEKEQIIVVLNGGDIPCQNKSFFKL